MTEPDGATSISDGLDAGIQVLFDDPMCDHQSPECDSYGPGTNHHDCASFDKQRFGDERLETYRTKPGFCAHLAPKPTEPCACAFGLEGYYNFSAPAPRSRLLRSRRLGRSVVLRRGSVAVPHGDAVGRLPERGVDRLLVGRQRPDRPRHVPRPLHGARRGDVVREALRRRPGVHGLRRRRVPHGLQRRPLRRVPHVHDRDSRQRRGVRARRHGPSRVGAAECYIKKDTVCACTSVNPWCSPETGWCYQSEAVAIALPISAYNPFTQDPNCFSCNQHFEADAGDLSAYDLCPLVSCGCCDRDANGLCNAAGNRGPSREGVSKVMLVLTDGEQTIDGDDSTAIAMADVAKRAGIKVFAVGFGSADKETIISMASEPSATLTPFSISDLRGWMFSRRSGPKRSA